MRHIVNPNFGTPIQMGFFVDRVIGHFNVCIPHISRHRAVKAF